MFVPRGLTLILQDYFIWTGAVLWLSHSQWRYPGEYEQGNDTNPLITDNITTTILHHWGWVTHICVSKLTIIVVNWTLSMLRNMLSEIFDRKTILFKMPSGKWRPFCLGLSVLSISIFQSRANSRFAPSQGLGQFHFFNSIPIPIPLFSIPIPIPLLTISFNSNSNSGNFNSNSNSGDFKSRQFQFWKWPVDVFLEIDYNYTNKVHAYKIIGINTISLISLVKWI